MSLSENYSDELFRSFFKKYKLLNKEDAGTNTFEIDAQIHAIKQSKELLNYDWDTMTLIDLFYRYTTLRSIADRLYEIDPKVYTLWLQDLVKRMDRENLLGKNMRIFPKHSDLYKEDIFNI